MPVPGQQNFGVKYSAEIEKPHFIRPPRCDDSGHWTITDYAHAVSRGMVAGAIPFGGYGERIASGAETGVIWSDGAFVYPAAVGVQLSVVSTSADDDGSPAGTGARTVDIHYLDADLAERVETVVMNGVTPVLTVATNIRFVQCMHLVTFGSGKKAAGTITASNGANVHSQIYTGSLRCSSSVRMVPAGKRLCVTSMFGGAVSGTAAAKVLIRIATPTFDGHDFTENSVFMPLFSAGFQDSSAGLTIPAPMYFKAGQSVGMIFESDKAATVIGSWFGWLENNDSDAYN